MNQQEMRARVVFLVVGILGILSTIGVSSLCLTLFFRNYADPAVLTAIISITSGLVGSLSTILLASPRPQASTPDITVSAPPPKVEIEQPK